MRERALERQYQAGGSYEYEKREEDVMDFVECFVRDSRNGGGSSSRSSGCVDDARARYKAI